MPAEIESFEGRHDVPTLPVAPMTITLPPSTIEAEPVQHLDGEPTKPWVTVRYVGGFLSGQSWDMPDIGDGCLFILTELVGERRRAIYRRVGSIMRQVPPEVEFR